MPNEAGGKLIDSTNRFEELRRQNEEFRRQEEAYRRSLEDPLRLPAIITLENNTKSEFASQKSEAGIRAEFGRIEILESEIADLEEFFSIPEAADMLGADEKRQELNEKKKRLARAIKNLDKFSTSIKGLPFELRQRMSEIYRRSQRGPMAPNAGEPEVEHEEQA